MRAVRAGALINSLKLAALAFVIVVVPLGIIGGVIAALYAGSRGPGHLGDRALAATVPEFVSGIVLIVIFGVELKLAAGRAPRPGRARAASASSGISILPAIPLVLVLFGYIARMARAGTIEVLSCRLHADRRAQGPAARPP